MSDIKVTHYMWEDVERQIGLIREAGKTLQSKIHSVAVAILKHWHDNADARSDCAKALTDLQNASPYHSAAFAKWVAGLTHQNKKGVTVRSIPLEWADEGKCWYSPKGGKQIKGKGFIAARDMPFHVFSPAPKANPINDIEEVDKLIQRLRTRMAKPKEGDVVHVDFLNRLTQTVSEWKQEQEMVA